MFDIEDNFTANGSDGNYSDGYEREDFPLINLYLALPLRIIMSLAIITSASIVLLAIKRSKRTTFTLHLFYISNLMIADIGFAVIHNGAAIVNIILALARSTRMDCRIIATAAFSVTTNSMMLAALCFDCLYSAVAPLHYRREMTKKRGYVIVSAIWLITLLLSFLSFFDPQINSTKTEGVICGYPLYKKLGLLIITLLLILSAVFVVIQNIYLYCILVKTTIRRDTNNSSMTIAEALRTIKETKKVSMTLSILSGTSIVFGIINPITAIAIQRKVGNGLFTAIWFSLIIPFVHNFSILLHSVLYGYFLQCIRESLRLNIC